MIKYRFYACKHLTSDILQRTYLNQEQTYDILSTSKVGKSKIINIIFMFLKRAKVVIVKFMSIQHIFVILCLFPSYEHQGYFV